MFIEKFELPINLRLTTEGTALHYVNVEPSKNFEKNSNFMGN